jgi:hypothetical protein
MIRLKIYKKIKHKDLFDIYNKFIFEKKIILLYIFKKMIIYGVNSINYENFDLILSDTPPYFNFNNIKISIQQYDFIVLLDDAFFFDRQKIIEFIEFLIQNDYDQLLLDNSQPKSLEIMEYDYYKRIIKSNRIFKNLTKEDLKQKNQPNDFRPFQFTLQPSIIRTKNFILPNFFLKKNPHIENLYWRELVKNSFKIFNNNSKENYKKISNFTEKNNLTIITGYLNIKIKRPSKSNTANQIYDYIEKSRGTLQIPQYMVIYCSEELINDVTKIREENGLLNKTKIIAITLENNLYMIDKLDKIRENVAKNNPPYDIPEYILAVNSRYGYIQNTIENNYFNTDYFAWVDFSASHIVNIPPNKIIEPKSHDKVRIGWIARYSNNQFVYNHYCLGGGLFSGHKEIMMELIKLHHLEFVKLTEMGYNINDDKLLFIIMEQNPYLFDTFFSDYKNLFIRL